MSDKPIHLHKNIVDRKRNTFLLFIPTFIFVIFLTVMFSLYKAVQLPRDRYEATLGETDNVDNRVEFNAK